MNKVQLAEKLAQERKTTKKEANEWVEAIFQTMEKTLKKGEIVKISGFGRFTVKNVAAKVVKSPNSDKMIHVPASKKVAFKQSEKLKASL
jgi:DNA-binding protein HU-beta